MATKPATTYFPPLDRCMSGQEAVIPWTTAYAGLSDFASAASNMALESLFHDEETTKVLSQPDKPFSQPDAQSKQSFETKVAPINVSQSANGDYDLQQMKDDALWLAKEMGVAELAALRCTIVEWQSRAADLILGRIPVENGAQELQQSLLGRSTFKSTVNGAASSGPDFKDEDLRRSRLLQIFLDEQSAARACSAIFMSKGADQARDPPLDARSPVSPLGGEHRTWMDVEAKSVFDESKVQGFSLERSISSLRDLAQSINDMNSWPGTLKDRAQMAMPFLDSLVKDMTSALRVLLAQVYLVDRPPRASDVQAWYKLMEEQSFFASFSPITPTQNACAPILQCLVAVVSAAILKLPEAFEAIERTSSADQGSSQVRYPDLGAEPYTADLDCLKLVNRVLFHALIAALPTAGPAVFAWSLLTAEIQSRALLDEMRTQEAEQSDSDTNTRRRPSALRGSSRPPTAMEKAWEVIQDFDFGEHRGDVPQFMASTAIEQMSLLPIIEQLSMTLSVAFTAESETATNVVSRLALWEVLQSGLQFLDYAGAIEATIALLHPGSPNCPPASPRLQTALYSSERFGRYVLDMTLSRFPFELDPLLQLLIPLAGMATDDSSLVVQILENLTSFLVMVPENFRAYALENEDEGTNSVYLTEDIAIFEPRASLGWYQTPSESRALVLADGGSSNVVSTIPAGTPGVVMRDTRPFVFRLEHTYSGLAYLGVLLSTISRNSELVVPAGYSGSIDKASAALIVDLLTAILKPVANRDEQDWILGRFGSALRDEIDVVAVIAEIAESELLAHIERAAEAGSHELLVSCINFFEVLAVLSPERTWSWLSRSSLLGQTSGVSALAAVVSNAETQTGLFPFLSACVKLYETVLDDAIYGVVKRRPKVERDLGRRRFDSPMEALETPERTIASVLAAYTRVVQDVLLTCHDMTFVVLDERLAIVTTLCRAFGKLLRASYGIGIATDGEKLTDVLTLAATTQTVSDFVLAPLAAVLSMGAQVSDSALTASQRIALVAQTVTALDYLTTIVRTLKARNNGTAGSLPTQIIKLSGQLAMLFASHEAFRGPVAGLLGELLRQDTTELPSILGQLPQAQRLTSAPQDNTELPSILGQLPQETLKSFLSLLSQLDRPLRDNHTECKIWDFLSSVLDSGHQQYFAMYILTGTLPRDRYKTTEYGTTHKTLLRDALEQLNSIDKGVNPDRAISMLNFIAKAQQVWTFATNEVREKTDFVKSALTWLEGLEPVSRGGSVAEALIKIKEFRMAALVCDILAVNLHASAEVGDKTLLKMLAPKLAFLSEHGAKVDGYNASLHANLSRNLPKWASCQPDDFKRTSANPAPLGENYVYDLHLAGRMLAHEPHWHGRQGYAEEFNRANVNLSLVQAQTGLLKGWGRLATTLSDCANLEQGLQGVLVTAAIRALEANEEMGLDVPNAADVLQIRAELAFVLVSRLVAQKSTQDRMRDLLPVAWSLVRSCPVSYDVATAPEDLRYYTSLLQILYLAIQPHTYMDPKPLPHGIGTQTPLAPTISSALVEITGHVVARGWRALCANIDIFAQPADFALLAAILRAILNVKGVKLLHSQLADQVAGSGLVRGALSLFSWSHRLEDPVYAELAMGLLVTLSSVPQIAEQMALESVLAQLSSATLSEYFRKPGGQGPFDDLFAIWSQGFLPLSLNLLAAVGAPIAPEISAFLNSFPLQLKRAERGLANSKPTPRNPRAGAITLSLVSEARDLLLLSRVLESAAMIGSAEGVVGSEVQPLEMDTAGLREDVEALRGNLRGRVVAVGEREVRLGDDGLVEEVMRVLRGIAS